MSKDTTGKIVGGLAGRILSADEMSGEIVLWHGSRRTVVTAKQIRSMSGSLVNQVRDRKRKRKAASKKKRTPRKGFLR